MPFQKENKLWDNPKSKATQFKKGHKVGVGRKRLDMVGNKFRLRAIPWNKGLKNCYSKETIERMSEAKIGKPSWNKGKKCPNPKTKGKNHWNWKNGITDERTKLWNSGEYAKWRKAVYGRDSYTCQKFKDNSGNNLIPHHIESFADFPMLRLIVDNGIVFCKNCHTYFHSKYGTHHNNREQLKEFLNENNVLSAVGQKI